MSTIVANEISSRRTYTRLVLAVLFVALTVRVGAAVYWHSATTESGQLFRLGDSHSYWVLAGQIAKGEPYEYGSTDAKVFRAPIYPIVLAPFYALSQEQSGVFAARVMGCMLGTLAVGLVIALTRTIANRRASLVSGLVAALYPGAVGMSVVILSEAVFCPLMLGMLLLWIRSLPRTLTNRLLSRTVDNAATDTLAEREGGLATYSWLSAAAAGGLCGLAILTRPSWLLFSPFAGTILLGCFPNRSSQFKILCVMALACWAVMSPWWIRNWNATGHFVPTTLQVGASLYDGLHDGASGGSDENMVFVDEFIRQLREEFAQASKDEVEKSKASRPLNFEYELNARMSNAAILWVRENPAGAFRLSLLKFAKTWSLWPAAGEIGSTSVRLVLTSSCLAVLCLASVATWRSGRDRRWIFTLIWLPALYFTLLHMVFVGSIRYREPAMLVLTVLAGACFYRNSTARDRGYSAPPSQQPASH